MKVASPNPAVPVKVASLNPASPVKVASSNRRSPVKVAPSNPASPVKVAPSNPASPVKVASSNTASPVKVAPLKSTLSSNLQDSNRIGGNRLPSNPPRSPDTTAPRRLIAAPAPIPQASPSPDRIAFKTAARTLRSVSSSWDRSHSPPV